ncbi:MAG TPA: hypothetical protein VEB59_02465 [Gemmatimonadales bacterium]|nr:hypothetical protein [Gemmatimonadales bacterium]
MANEVLPPTLEQALAVMGNAHAYVGSFLAANSAAPIGQKEGNIAWGGTPLTFNFLEAPEITGPAKHDAIAMGEDPIITIPLIVPADGSIWAATSPTGGQGGGYSFPQSPTFTSLAIIPDREVGGGLKFTPGSPGSWTRLAGNGVGAASGAGAAPVNAVWFWKVVLSRGNTEWNGTALKMIIPVTAQAFYRQESTIGNNLPEGQHQYTIGDPDAEGVVGFNFSMA